MSVAPKSKIPKPVQKPTLLFIRHEETRMNKQKLLRGQQNPPLNAQGLQAAKQTAQKVASYPLAHIYSSPLKRAHQTAQAVSDATNKTPITHADGLKPWDYGFLTGQPDNDENRGIMRHYQEHPDQQVPQGESYGQFLNRFGDAVRKLRDGVKQNPGRPVAVVTHSRNLYALRHVLDGKSSIPTHGGFPPGTITKVEFDDNRPNGFTMSKL